MLLSECAHGRNNNYNLIRFIASAMVLYSHSYPLTGTAGEPLVEMFGLNFGHLAVDIFFIISGFLVTNSLISKKELIPFVMARILRVIPGLAVANLFCVLVVGIYYTKIPISSYLLNIETYQFLFNNITLMVKPLQWHLPGTFEDNPYKFVVNGSLWTLPWEMKMYLILVIVGILAYVKEAIISKNQVNYIVILIGATSTVFYLYYYYVSPEVGHDVVRFLSLFFIGGSFYILRNRIIISHRIFFILMLILFLLKDDRLFLSAYSLFIGYFVIYFSYMPRGYIRKFNSIGDYSYGMYIYAFPVQQSISASFPGISVTPMFLMAFTVTLVLSMLSWHYVEAPALKLKDSHKKIEDALNRLTKVCRLRKESS